MPEDQAAIALHPDEYMFMRFGPDPRWEPVFRTKRALRKAWKAHREHLMAIPAPGHRCWAWWELEAPPEVDDYPGYDNEPETLRRLGLLSEAEKAELFGVAPSAKPAA